jgi:hypothetical protein
MKKVFLSMIFLFTLASLLSAQMLVNSETLKVNDSTILMVGNDILINKPIGFDFVNIEEVKKSGFNIGKLANIGSAVGSTIGIAGANASNVGAMTTGIKVMQTASVASSIGWTQEAINALNVSDKAKSIVGKKMRILRFKKEGNEKRGEHFYAITAGEGKQDYRIEVEPAIENGEILMIHK